MFTGFMPETRASVSYERVVERVGPEIESGCPQLWEYLKPQLEAGRRKGFIATPAPPEGAISELK
jgi:hypothetical protein